MNTVNRRALGAAVLVGIGLVVWALQPQAVPVEVATVSKGGFEQTVAEDGKTRVRDHYGVSPPLDGRIEPIGL